MCEVSIDEGQVAIQRGIRVLVLDAQPYQLLREKLVDERGPEYPGIQQKVILAYGTKELLEESRHQRGGRL